MLKLKNLETIVFAGDSITDAERARPIGEGLWAGVGNGYVRAFDSILNAFYPELCVRVINMGNNGANSRDMLATWDKEVLAFQPDHVVMCIGGNDVWRQFDSPTCTDQHILPDEYERNIRALLRSAKENIRHTVIMTPYYMEPHVQEPMRVRMCEYGAIVKKVAAEFGADCIDLQAVFDRYMAYRHPSYLQWDRIHPGPVGSMLIASQVLKVFGFDRSIVE